MNEYCDKHEELMRRVDRMDKDIYGEDAHTPSIFEMIRELKKQVRTIYRIPSILILILTILKVVEIIIKYFGGKQW